jgi:hypothetical protein
MADTCYTLRLPNNDGMGTALGAQIFDPDGKRMPGVFGFELRGHPAELMTAKIEVAVRIEVEHTVSVKLEMPR